MMMMMMMMMIFTATLHVIKIQNLQLVSPVENVSGDWFSKQLFGKKIGQITEGFLSCSTSDKCVQWLLIAWLV